MRAGDLGPTAPWRILERRAELIARARRFFVERGYLEVETPVLSRDTVVDRHLDPLRTVDGRWLQTSPEFAMKRMLIAEGGPGGIFQLARVFRAHESGALHNPEFTMLEWYRLGDGVEEQLALLEELAAELLRDRWPGADGAPRPLAEKAERLSYRDLFLRELAIDPLRSGAAELEDGARRRGVVIPEGLGEDPDPWLDLLLTECLQPGLGRGRPTLLVDFPASQAALARLRPGTPPVAERFELYVDGVELANGYHELTDPRELRSRNRRQNERRVADGKAVLPEESRLLDAMEEGLPPCAGVALGVDRIVMLATGASHIDEVIAFPADRA